MFRWGVLSTALIGREHLIPAFVDAENGVLNAIASRDEARAKAVAERFGIPNAFGSYEALLASDQVDGIYIPLPTSQHIEWSLRAAEAGKHVLCEKPIALKADEIDALIDMRDRMGVVISEAFMVTYHPQWLKVKALLAEGAIGRLRHVQGAFAYFNRDAANMRNVVALGGGALPDIGVYPTVTTRFVTGQEPVRVMARVERDPDFGTDIYSAVTADFGAFDMSFYISTQMAQRQEMVFHGETGWIRVETPFNAGLYGADVVTLHDQHRGGEEVFRFPGVRQYVLEAEAFARAVAGEGQVYSLEDSRANQRFIDAIYAAGDAGGWGCRRLG